MAVGGPPPDARGRRRAGRRCRPSLLAAAAAAALLGVVGGTPPAAGAPPEWGATVLRIDAGATGDAGAPAWTPDRWFSGGRPATTAAGTPIDGTTEDAVLRSARVGAHFTYTIPVRPGTRVSVAVLAAETWAPNFGVGRRLFDIHIGDRAASLRLAHRHVDVYARVGARSTAYLYAQPLTVGPSGTVVVSFRALPNKNLAIACGLLLKVEGGAVPAGLPLAPVPAAPPGAPHLAHAVSGGPYTEYDYTGNGATTVRLDGTGSHSHWDGATKTSGKVVSYHWVNRRSGRTLCRAPVCAMRFELGATPVLLTVRDSLGTVSSDGTTVTVTDGYLPGVWCTFQRRPDRGTAVAPSVWARLSKPPASWATRLTSVDVDRLPVPFAAAAVGARCVGHFVAPTAKVYTFHVTAAGAAALAVKGKALLTATGGGGGSAAAAPATHTAAVWLPAGTHPLRLTYAKAAGAPTRLRLGVDAHTPHRHGSLVYRDNAVVPTLHYLSVPTGRPYDVLKVTGAAFRRDEAVYFDAVKAATVRDGAGSTTPGTIYARVPPRLVGRVTVTVRSTNGRSTNGLPFRILAAGEAGGTLARFGAPTAVAAPAGGAWAIDAPTAVAVGPDGRLYVGTLAAGILVADVDYATHTVRSSCGSGSVGAHRSILGVAFNPLDWVAGAPVRVHVATSTLYWGRDKRLPAASGWRNGAVEAYTAVPPRAGGVCLVKAATVVSGLPVSDHDHAVNGLAFNADGDLFIQVGGVTNVGLPSAPFESLHESVLSAATLKAETSKGPAFDGAVTYSPSDDPATAVQVGGKDVSVFASGLRNSLSVLPHSNGQVYATDNGTLGGGLRVPTQMLFVAS